MGRRKIHERFPKGDRQYIRICCNSCNAYVLTPQRRLIRGVQVCNKCGLKYKHSILSAKIKKNIRDRMAVSTLIN